MTPTAIPPLHLHQQARAQRQAHDRQITQSVQLQCRVLKATRRNRLTPAQLAAAPDALL